MKIILIDQNREILSSLKEELEEDGFVVTAMYSSDLLEVPGFDLSSYKAIITDCDEPRFNGLNVVRMVSGEPNPVPCLVHSWTSVVKTKGGNLYLPQWAEDYDFVTYRQRRVGAVAYIWRFLRSVWDQSHS